MAAAQRQQRTHWHGHVDHVGIRMLSLSLQLLLLVAWLPQGAWSQLTITAVTARRLMMVLLPTLSSGQLELKSLARFLLLALPRCYGEPFRKKLWIKLVKLWRKLELGG